MMTRISMIFVVSVGLTAAHAQPQTPRPVVHAYHIAEQITVDGILSESAWQGPGFSDFIQRDPNQGEQPSERTEVWVAYDDAAIYVAARLYDASPDSIMQLLGRRDAYITADWFNLYLDPYHDRRTGYFFALSASGTMYDGTLLNDDWTDDSWDGVWEGKTSVDELGWALEMRIPFTQLRFHQKDEYVWGVNFKRTIGRKNEFDYMVYTPRDESGFVSRFADLVGIRGVVPLRQIEVLPYVNARAEYSNEPVGNPFHNGSRYLPGVGADLKVGLTSNLTLDATVNPDFGQVEVDPAVVNLSDVETYFQEKRPFFIEGANVFEFGYGGSSDFWSFNWSNPAVFYSRRIGRSPQGRLPSYDYVDLPLGTHILGAAKLTGRLFDTWKIGTTHATTNREFARVSTGGNQTEVEVEPLTYYGIGRVQRDFNDGRQGVGFIGTYARRMFSDPRLRNEINSDAIVAGADGWTFLDEEKTYVVTGWGVFSHVRGTASRILSLQTSSQHYYQRPDASHVAVDSSATSLTGMAGRVMLNKQKGPVILNAAFGIIEPDFDVNDLGFQWRTDRLNGHIALGYKWTTPTAVFRDLRLRASTFVTYDHGGNKTWHGYWHSGSIQFPNYYSFYWGFAYNPHTMDNTRTRGGPVMLTLPGREVYLEVSSDSRKSVVLGLNGFTYHRANEPSFQIEASMEWKPMPSFSLKFGPYFGRDRTQAQYVTTIDDALATSTFGRRYVFAVLDQATLGASLRLDWTFTPHLSLQLYMQPLISAGDYHDYKELTAPRTFNFLRYGDDGSTVSEVVDGSGQVTSYTVDPDGSGPAASFGVPNRDFTVTSLRGNAVLRWEYRPGSILYFVWTRSSFGSLADGRFNFSRAVDRLIDTETANILMVKFTYWFSM